MLVLCESSKELAASSTEISQNGSARDGIKGLLTSVLAFFVMLAAVAQGAVVARDGDVHCGTTNDATFSDCQTLLNDDATWNAAWAGTSNVCHYTNVLMPAFDAVAYNTACHGNCCVYWASSSQEGSPDKDTTRANAQGLLGCADRDVNKINGLDHFKSQGYGVCISDGSGCGDCFDDADFAF